MEAIRKGFYDVYKIYNKQVPQEKRKEINEKIIHLIQNNLCDKYNVTKEQVYNLYSGFGGLHGLNFNDYNSYHSFSEAKKEIENGAFFTPHILCKWIVDTLRISDHDTVLDLTAGMGNFFNWLPVQSNAHGNELEYKNFLVMKHLYPEANLTHGDMREYNTNKRFDIVLGNPPFNLTGFRYGDRQVNSQMYFMFKCAELMRPGALCAVIVPNSFLSDEFSDKSDIQAINNNFNHIVTVSLPSNAFKHVGVSNFSTKLLFFQRKSEHISDHEYLVTAPILSLSDFSEASAAQVYNNYIKSVTEQRESLKAKLYIETVRSVSNEDREFEAKVKKLLYDIKQNPRTKVKINSCMDYVEKLKNQSKPEGMDWKEYEKIRVTPNKVLSYLKRVIREQHKQERDIVRLVKTDNTIRLKGYSHKTKLQLSKMTTTKEMSLNDMIIGNSYPFEDGQYKKLLQRKIKAYEKQNQKWEQIEQDKDIEKFLSEFSVTDTVNSRIIKLNDIQRHDVNLLLQKKYSYLQYGTGAGKSICGLSMIQYRFKHNNIKNAFIVAPAIAITNNWCDILESYNIPFTEIRSVKDIDNIQSGQIVLVTFNMLVKYKKQIKKFIKIQNNKIMFVCDEADGIMNLSSRRSLATIDVFKHAKYKLLMSANMVRNAIPEAFAGFYMLYLSSVNLINKAEKIYVENTKTKEIEEKQNSHHMKAFPAHKKGHTLFRRTFSPSRASVFGINRNTQDVVNSSLLKELIDKTIITRTFEEVSGKDIYKIIQHTCEFNSSERELYKTIIEEFYRLSDAFKRTGNHRKDALLQIIAQLNALLRSCTIPNSFKGYGSIMPSKALKMLEILEGWNDELVAIGCVNIKTVEMYSNYIRNHFPGRKVFTITGKETTLKQRKKIIEELRKSKNGILLATQSSLSMSMNVDFVNKILNIQLPYNYSSVWQFTARFIRYTSTEQKEVHFLTANNSLEFNLLQLLVTKEALTSYMRNDDLSYGELYEHFGIDFNILDALLIREHDSLTGRSYIKWGNQNIV